VRPCFSVHLHFKHSFNHSCFHVADEQNNVCLVDMLLSEIRTGTKLKTRRAD